MHSLGLTCATTNLGEQKVDAEWCILVIQVALELSNLLSQHVRCVTDTTDDTKTSGVGNSSSELRTSGHVHTGQNNGVLDLKQIGELCADLLYGTSANTWKRPKANAYVEKTWRLICIEMSEYRKIQIL